MIRDSYKTIELPTEGPIYKDKGSKFYGFAFPVQSPEQIKTILEGLWKEHSSARHICYAWQLGVKETRFKASDDGEPHNSAGMPILGQISAFDLSFVLLAVVRYYGGRKLGVSGLIQAYKSSARGSLQAARVTEREIQDQYKIRFGYDRINPVNQIIKRNQWDVISREMKEVCTYIVGVRLSEAVRFENEVERQQGVVIEDVLKYSDGMN